MKHTTSEHQHQEAQRLLGPTSYLESIKPTFVCPYCGYRKEEKRGKLAKKSVLSEPQMVCGLCIHDAGLLIVPDYK